MSTRPSVSPAERDPAPVRTACLLVLLTLCSILPPVAARADQTIVVTLSLNSEAKGDAFVVLRDDGDFLVRSEDLDAIGLHPLPGGTIELDGAPHHPLRSLPGVTFRFDEATLTLALVAAPELLPKATRDLSVARKSDVFFPRDRSLFVNYGLDYSAGGASFDFAGFALGNEFGLRLPDLLLLTDTLYTSTPDDARFVRLNTTLTWDDRRQLRRAVAGDFVTGSDELGSQTRMAGVGLAKVYRIDPYFVRYPLFDFAGQAPLPSEVELYVDGIRVHSERFAPGAFELRNLAGIGGTRTIEVVVRDALGREERFTLPFYFTDRLLRRGLHEYGYYLGLLREEYGLESNAYGAPAASAFHRYGVADWFNLGGHVEGGDGLLNAGLETTFKLAAYGQLSLAAAGSQKDGTGGSTALLGYELQSSTFRALFACQSFSAGYRTLANPETAQHTKLHLRAGLGYGTPRLGSFDLGLARYATYNDNDRTVLSLSWSRRLLPGTYLSASLRRVDAPDATSYEGLLNLTWALDRDHSLGAALTHTDDEDRQTLEVRRDLPGGEGTGWNLRAEHASGSDDGYLLRSLVQHHARRAILRGDLGVGESSAAATRELRLNLSGGMVYLGRTFALTRPVTDSFALVRVGETPGVRVKVNGQPSGQTDRHGRVVVPDLSSYYENQISIEDRDLPLDYLVQRVRFDVSPPLRSGTCISFPAQRYQAFSGTLLVADGSAPRPLADAELTLATPGGEVRFQSGRNGEFYFDDVQESSALSARQGCQGTAAGGGGLSAGRYRLGVRAGEQSFAAGLTLPATGEPYVDLGEVVLTPEEDAPTPP